mmetsp:Transcript_15731/g.50142  ORF Transcript_15731/g.50142 Transcript_15731/m.50142 type:complete len:242 (-) Transcript_15731:102-827(-)
MLGCGLSLRSGSVPRRSNGLERPPARWHLFRRPGTPRSQAGWCCLRGGRASVRIMASTSVPCPAAERHCLLQHLRVPPARAPRRTAHILALGDQDPPCARRPCHRPLPSSPSPPDVPLLHGPSLLRRGSSAGAHGAGPLLLPPLRAGGPPREHALFWVSSRSAAPLCAAAPPLPAPRVPRRRLRHRPGPAGAPRHHARAAPGEAAAAELQLRTRARLRRRLRRRIGDVSGPFRLRPRRGSG